MECLPISEDEVASILDKYPDLTPHKPLQSHWVYVLPDKSIVITPSGSFALTKV